MESVVVAGCLTAGLAVALAFSDDAKEHMRRDACLEQMAAIGKASLAYTAADPNGWAIPVHYRQFMQEGKKPDMVGAYEWGGKSGVGGEGYVFRFEEPPQPPSSRYGTIAGFGPDSRPLNKYLYPSMFPGQVDPAAKRTPLEDTKLDLPIFRCPSDDGPPGGAHCTDWIGHKNRSSYDHFGTSYAANLLWMASERSSWFDEGEINELFGISPYLRPAKRVPDPRETILYEENIGRWAWACRREACEKYAPGLDPGPTKSVRGWHRQDWTFNHTYVDGHVATRTILIDETQDAEGYFQHYRKGIVSDDAEIQQCLECETVRGDGWQKDVLPSDPIPTGLHWNGKGRPALEDCFGQ